MQVKSILIVEDNQAIRRVMEVSLAKEFDVFTAESGEAGLIIAEAEEPDLILLDIRMPIMDGPETLERLRSNPGTEEIPVIFLTASIQTHELEQYKKMDVLGVIEKPFDPMKIAGQIRQMTAKI